MQLERSKTYKRILEHRRTCDKWGKGFCLKCFGGGLSHFIQDIELEKLNHKKSKGTKK